jgi:tetratricopeptide (TPR) repeat protein
VRIPVILQVHCHRRINSCRAALDRPAEGGRAYAVLLRSLILLFLIALLGPAAQADTIVLKNGRTIYAEVVREVGTKIEYEIDENTFAIPRAVVARIDRTRGAAPKSSRALLESFTPSEEPAVRTNVDFEVVNNGRVDLDALASLETHGDRQTLAFAYFQAGRHEMSSGRTEQAQRYLQRALGIEPENVPVLTNYATVLIKLGRAAEAIQYAERATRIAPESADAHATLGFAFYGADRSRNALPAWKRSLELRHDPKVQAFLEHVERELSVEKGFSERLSGHFTLRFEGTRKAEALGRQVLDTLEAHYGELTAELGSAPRASIAVILYTDEAFFDVTRAPGWSSAINDGKLRIPIDGVGTITPEFSRVLKHELAHSFINYVSRERCPHWLHEGIAQLIEPERLGSLGPGMAKLYAQKRQVPLMALERSFMSLNSQQAGVAYAESLAAAEYIHDSYGMSELRRLLERIGQGASTEEALRMTIRADYQRLEEELALFLKNKYGE